MVVLKENHKHNEGALLRFLLALHFQIYNPSFHNNHFNLKSLFNEQVYLYFGNRK